MKSSYKGELTELMRVSHDQAQRKGWWVKEEELIANSPEAEAYIIGARLGLIHTEVSEAIEGHRSDLWDDKLPHRKQLEVELADIIIRVFDIAGFLNLDIGGAFDEKMKYNLTRKDHDLREREKTGGKQY